MIIDCFPSVNMFTTPVLSSHTDRDGRDSGAFIRWRIDNYATNYNGRKIAAINKAVLYMPPWCD